MTKTLSLKEARSQFSDIVDRAGRVLGTSCRHEEWTAGGSGDGGR